MNARSQTAPRQDIISTIKRYTVVTLTSAATATIPHLPAIAADTTEVITADITADIIDITD